MPHCSSSATELSGVVASRLRVHWLGLLGSCGLTPDFNWCAARDRLSVANRRVNGTAADRIISSSTRMNLERIRDGLQEELAVLMDEENNLVRSNVRSDHFPPVLSPTRSMLVLRSIIASNNRDGIRYVS